MELPFCCTYTRFIKMAHPAMHFLLSSALLGLAAQAQTFDPLEYIDPLIGTGAGSSVFPGATLPYGMARLLPILIRHPTKVASRWMDPLFMVRDSQCASGLVYH